MTRDQALQYIIQSNIVEKIANRYASYTNELKDDFIQYLYWLLCEMAEDKIVGLVERNEIEFYLLYVGKAQATNALSDFNKLHRGRIQTTELNENKIDEDGEDL